MKKGIDYIGLGTGAMIFNSEGKVFLAKRGPESRIDAGTWDFPGGAVDFGETCEEAIKREIMEEFGMTIEVTGFLEFTDDIQDRFHFAGPNFKARHVSGEPEIKEPHKCTGIKWVSVDEIDVDLLSNASKSVYKIYMEKHG